MCDNSQYNPENGIPTGRTEKFHVLQIFIGFCRFCHMVCVCAVCAVCAKYAVSVAEAKVKILSHHLQLPEY